MEHFAVFRTPQTILYGRKSFQQVGEQTALKGTKALIVTDEVMLKLGYVEQCQDLLRKEGIESERYSGVESEPTDLYVSESLRALEKDRL